MAFLIKRKLKKGFAWVVEWKSGDKKVHRVSTKTDDRTEAEKLLKHYEEKERRKELPEDNVEEKVYTFQKLITNYMDNMRVDPNFSQSWIREKPYYIKKLKSFFPENMLLTDFTVEKLLEYKTKSLKGKLERINDYKRQGIKKSSYKNVSLGSVKNEMNCLMSMLRHAVYLEWITNEDLPKLKTIKAPTNIRRQLTDIELLSLKELIRYPVSPEDYAEQGIDTNKNPRPIFAMPKGEFKIAIELFMFTGMRLGEVAYLRWPDVDFSNDSDNRFIHIRRHIRESKTDKFEEWNPKCLSERDIPIKDYIYKSLLEWRRKSSEGNIYVVSEGIKGKENWLGLHVKKLIVSAGIRGCSAHNIRHTFATICSNAGIPISTIQELLGHRQLETTRRYIHITKKSLLSAMQSIKI
jgi:integrase